MTGSHPTLRERPVITAALIAARGWLPEAVSPEFIRGAIAGFEWVLGTTDRAPVSGAAAAPDVERIRREEDLADDAVGGRPGAPNVGQDYAIGAQHALMWARGATDDPPVGFTPAS